LVRSAISITVTPDSECPFTTALGNYEQLLTMASMPLSDDVGAEVRDRERERWASGVRLTSGVS
jgi:hypothetical protein